MPHNRLVRYSEKHFSLKKKRKLPRQLQRHPHATTSSRNCGEKLKNPNHLINIAHISHIQREILENYTRSQSDAQSHSKMRKRDTLIAIKHEFKCNHGEYVKFAHYQLKILGTHATPAGNPKIHASQITFNEPLWHKDSISKHISPMGKHRSLRAV